MSSLSDDELTRLRAALKENYSQGDKLRKQRAECLALFAGTQYPDIKTDGYQDYVNKLRQSALAQVISLAAGRPRALVTTHNPQLKAWAKKRSRALDAYSKSLRLERVLQRCAFGGFFGLGIAKVAMLESPVVFMRSSAFLQAGRPGVVDVSLDHLVWDLDAADFDSCSFIGDRYRVRYLDAINDTRFSAEARRELKSLGPQSLNSSQSEPTAENIARTTTSENARFEDWIYLTDVFIQSKQCIYTFGCDSEFNIVTGPLFHLDWEGKPTGPYSFFSLGYVPGNTKPSAPAFHLKLQHNLINTIYRKLGDQVENCKDVFLAQAGDEGDAMRIRSAKDQGIVSINGVNGMKRETFGGPNQLLMGAVYKFEDVYEESDGGSKRRLGVGQSADTLGQEEMLASAGNGVTYYERGLFAEFLSEVYGELLGLLERDATLTIPMMLNIPGTGISIKDDWQPSTVEGSRGIGDPAEFDVEIDPYSLPYKTPGQRAMECQQIWNEMLPQWEMMSQQGIQPDMAAYLEGQSRFRNNPDIRDLFKFNQPLPPIGPAREPARGGASRANKPNGKYEHTSTPRSGGDKRGEILGMMAASAADNRS